MYRNTRSIHKLIGIVLSVFLVMLGITGLLLAMKSKVSWMRPETKKGGEVASFSEVVSIEKVVDAVVAAGLPQIKSADDIERIDYRPGKNVFKVVSADTLWEVQVDGKTGEVVNKAFRTDQFAENIHDLSFIHENARAYFLPFVGAGLAVLGVSGVIIYVVPVIRRRSNKAKIEQAKKDR